jgi:hypothetical protein
MYKYPKGLYNAICLALDMGETREEILQRIAITSSMLDVLIWERDSLRRKEKNRRDYLRKKERKKKDGQTYKDVGGLASLP